MALVRSRSTEFFPHKEISSTTRKLQEALYTHLDDIEKITFIEALSVYGTQRDIFELVNELRKILNTPVKRRLFPLVRQVIRPGDADAFDLLTRGDKHQSSTLPRPYLYRPHIADLNVLKKHRASSLGGGRSRSRHREDGGRSTSTGISSGGNNKSKRQNDSIKIQNLQACDIANGTSGRDDKHKTLSRRSATVKEEDDGEIVEMDIGTPDDDTGGFGFAIRGGHEHRMGVYVSSVNKGSSAQRCGLLAGDLILEANHINFRNISHDEAALLIKAATYLILTVSRVGRIPGSHTVLETFRWTDPKGRPVSPPGGWDDADNDDDDDDDDEVDGRGGGRGRRAGVVDDEARARSGTLMLKGRDERKVNVVVEKGHGLGLMVRGGKEYKLGIFVSAVDPFSVAANAGLKVGDQILDVNGSSFLDVTHADAVRKLKSGRHLMMTVKDVGKIPFAKTTIDETGWVQSSNFNTYVNSVSSRRSVTGSISDAEFQERGFSKGAGSQLMHSSTLPSSVRQQRELIHDQAKLLLNEREQMTLNYYISEYEKNTINLSGFSHALFEILNTPAKMTLLSELRTAVHPKDLNEFDQIVLDKELQSSLTEARGMLAPDVLSIGSFDSHDVTMKRKAKRTIFSQQIKRSSVPQTHRMDRLDFGEERETSPINYNLLASSRRLCRSTPSLPSHSPVATPRDPTNRQRDKKQSARVGSSSRSTSPNSAFQLMAQRHSWNQTHQRDGRAEDPSDDSGVEINNPVSPNNDINNYNTNYKHNGTSTVYHPGGKRMTFSPIQPKIYQGGYSKNLSSPQKKILHHLQRRDDQRSIEIAIGQGGRVFPEDSSRNYISSPSSANSHHVRHIEHVAEVHHSHGEFQRNRINEGQNTVSKTHGGYTTINRSNQHEGRSRSRSLQRNSRPMHHSKSRSRSRARSSDATVSRQARSRDPSREKFSDRYKNIDAEGVHQLNDNGYDYLFDDITKSHSLNSTPQQYRHQYNQNDNYETSSTSTVVNSVKSQSTLTINGQTMSPIPAKRMATGNKGGNKVLNLLQRKDQKQISDHHSRSKNTDSETGKIDSGKKTTFLAPPVSFSPTTSKRLQSLNPQSTINVRPVKKARSPKILRSPNVQRKHTRADTLFSKEEMAKERIMSSYPESSLESSPRDDFADFSQRKFRYGSQNTKNVAENHPTTRKHGDKAKRQNSLSIKVQKSKCGADQMLQDSKEPNQNERGIKSSVPLIRINSRSLPKVEAATLRSSIKGQNVTSEKTVNGDVYAVPFKPGMERVTISDIPVEINADSETDAYSVSTVSTIKYNVHNNSNHTNNGNVTSISLDRSSTKSRIEAIKEKAIDKYGELPLEVVYIYRSKPTLGVAIEGGANTRQPLPRVINVQPGGSAFESGGLKVGHVILEVNGHPAVGLSHMDAARLIAEAFKNKDSDRMEVLVTQWSDDLLDVIKVDAGLLKVESA